ncbi:DUF1932 domain-containing protein [Streptomyces mirabilis]|uniref:DUF1932 domain-containing protein n=1 Tax=Streptomyces mirabilis TaxID=68239 RepID=UPI0036AF6F62
MDQNVGILHPGSMGAAVAACAATNAANVLYCTDGRSSASLARAQEYGLTAVSSLPELLERCDMVISLCPPAAAEDVAAEVASHGFGGLYVDANAISIERMRRIEEMLSSHVKAVIDGGVIGSPPVNGKSPLLVLSGPAPAVARVEALFVHTAVRTKTLGPTIGQASALKLAYASFQKTSRVLVALSIALARVHDVDQELLDIAFQRTDSYLAEPEYVAKTAARAWRWGPEMEEVADTLEAAGLPSEMLRAAATTLARWNDAKDVELTLTDALNRLAQP